MSRRASRSVEARAARGALRMAEEPIEIAPATFCAAFVSVVNAPYVEPSIFAIRRAGHHQHVYLRT